LPGGFGCPGCRFHAGVVHSFTGTAKERDQLLEFPNIYIGINGCSLKTMENLEVMSGVPVERMMIETDSPYCDIKNTHAGIQYVTTTWPSKKKEKHDFQSLVKSRNEPCQIRQVLEVIAAHRKEQDVGSLASTIYENTCRVFFPHDIDSLVGAVLSGN
jgi:TatD DNase family protein